MFRWPGGEIEEFDTHLLFLPVMTADAVFVEDRLNFADEREPTDLTTPGLDVCRRLAGCGGALCRGHHALRFMTSDTGDIFAGHGC